MAAKGGGSAGAGASPASVLGGGSGGLSLGGARAAALTPLDEPRYRLQFVEETDGLRESNSVFLIGRKSDIPSAIHKVAALAEGTTKLVEAMVDSLEAPATSWASRESFIGGRVVVVLLPEECSRHNCRAAPVAIREALKSLVGSEESDFPAFVLLALPSADLAFASVCAVARAFPMYSRKTSAGSKKLRGAVVRVHCHTSDGSSPNLVRLGHTAASVRLAAALVDAPTNELHTDAFVDIARKVAAEVSATRVEVIRGTELRDGGFGGLWNVGKAAEHPPALVVLEKCPAGVDPASPAVVLIGKGIVYDTGGLSIKDRDNMVGMKRDCGGACAVLAAFRALALSGPLGKRVCAVLCLAENSVDSVAMRPDDVITLYSGKTVEVNNTDAEGRLVLADGAAYAIKHLNPAVILDIATLTGAQGVATGRHFAALYSNNEDLEELIVAAGRSSGDLVHPLPYAPEFFQAEFRSSVADMLNSVRDRANAQASCAAQFIAAHMGSFVKDGLWAHIDMAYPVFAGERATGYGVALLVSVVDKIRF